jgi:hypothetical protein
MNLPRKTPFFGQHRIIYNKKKDNYKGESYALKKCRYKKKEQLGED